MCSQDEDYYPSVSFLARLGYTVIGIDYPLSPHSRFPAALVSVLKGIQHAKKKYLPSKDMDCFLLGDSAGANLALLAALMMSNSGALEQFAETLQSETAADVKNLDLPRADGVISIYGMMEQTTCRDSPKTPTGMRVVNAGTTISHNIPFFPLYERTHWYKILLKRSYWF